MERRALVALPGLAVLAASRTFAMAAGDANTPRVSRKALLKHSGSKASYKVPRSAAKQTKYLNSLTALLSLTSGQQQQAAAVMAAAGSTHSSIRKNMKALRKALSAAVRAGNSGAIAAASADLGTLAGQEVANGAAAHAAVFQLLMTDQQAKLSQVMG